MLTRLRGLLEAVEDNLAIVSSGDLGYEVMLSGGDSARLAGMVGSHVELELLHYLESQSNGAVMRPRLVGFASRSDRAFFELFTSVKGIGYRKALRALQLPFDVIAKAIAEKDVDTLRSLPEIGKRTAETIILELHDKVDAVADMPAETLEPTAGPTAARSAVQVLVQLGESRLVAVDLVDRAGRADPELDTPDALVAAALRIKDT
ncbi:MAG: helix-hairpin-helix domain-containing protein [Phycisphaerales bacterium]|nr:helix-hairpin-helix domain-containing protein [Phycisphaerales bacterium]